MMGYSFITALLNTDYYEHLNSRRFIQSTTDDASFAVISFFRLLLKMRFVPT